MEETRKSNRSHFRLDSDYISLRALVAIADTGNFSAAADKIGRTQAAVSLQISKLEEQLQTRLLERSSRKVTQTPSGELMISYARRILSIADEAATVLSAPEAEAPFRIGFAEHLVPEYLHESLAFFRRAHPKQLFELKFGSSQTLGKELEKDNLDILIAGPGMNFSNFDKTFLFEEPLVWVANEKEELTQEKGPFPLIVMQPSCSYRKILTDALDKTNRSWYVAVEVNSVQGVKSAVRARMGVSILSRSAAGSMAVFSPVFSKLPMTETHAYRTGESHPLTERFLMFLQENFNLNSLQGAIL